MERPPLDRAPPKAKAIRHNVVLSLGDKARLEALLRFLLQPAAGCPPIPATDLRRILTRVTEAKRTDA